MKTLGLYIHIPYCLHKCGYCDFNSHTILPDEMERYVPALLREMRHYAVKLAGCEVTTLFLGGGTPTTLPTAALERILDVCGGIFRLAPQCEITIEANPATIQLRQLQRLRRAGYNRISIGVQSYHAAELQFLERVHSIEEVDLTVVRAREAGFDNLSLDLMFGLPGQTASRWEQTLARALDQRPEHLSAYNLTIEPETKFFHQHGQGNWRMPGEEHQLALFRQTIRTLESAGYRHYEISNFCRPDRECRHNINYWQNGEFLGLGAGAASFLDGVRHKNHNAPARYIRETGEKGSAVASAERLDTPAAMGETLMLGLRMLGGIDIRQFDRRFQTSFMDTYGTVVTGLKEKNLISLAGNQLALSRKGLFLADSVILEFIS